MSEDERDTWSGTESEPASTWPVPTPGTPVLPSASAIQPRKTPAPGAGAKKNKKKATAARKAATTRKKTSPTRKKTTATRKKATRGRR